MIGRQISVAQGLSRDRNGDRSRSQENFQPRVSLDPGGNDNARPAPAHLASLASHLTFQAMTDTSAGSGLSTSDQLSVERTRLSHDRTLMSNVRTSTALISFGFTIYKFFADLQQRGEIQHAHRPLGARNFSLLMMSIGVIYLGLASLSYMRHMKRMRAKYDVSIDRLPLALAGVISLLGILGLLSALLRQ